MSAFSAYRVSAYSRITRIVALRCFTPISARRFSGTSRIFPNPAANCKVGHLGVPSRVLGITLAYTFTGVPYADSFYRYRVFYSERTRAQLWHYSYTSFFHTTLALPNLRALRMRTKNTFLAVPTCYIGL